jgi:hypothetical protein
VVSKGESRAILADNTRHVNRSSAFACGSMVL